MLAPALEGTLAHLAEVTFTFDSSKIPSIDVSENIAGSAVVQGVLNSLLLKLGLKPAGSFVISSPEKISAPGVDLLCLLEALRCSRDDLFDPEVEGALLWGEINPIGEVSTKGELRACKGTFAVARLARDCGYQTIVIPARAYDPLLHLLDIEIVICSTIDQFIELASHWDQRKPVEGVKPSIEDRWVGCISQIEGCEIGKLAIEVMLAGRHSCLFLSNDPVSDVFPRLLKSAAPIVPEDIEEVLSIRSTLSSQILSAKDLFPIRQPHHTASRQGLLGGRACGEVNLAHRGVLVLNDAGQFAMSVVGDLMHSERYGSSYLYKSGEVVDHPALFTLFALSSSCPCGMRPCVDSQASRDRWHDRLRPFRERCSIQVDPTARADLSRPQTSAAIRERVMIARQINKPHVEARREAMRAGQILDPLDDLAHTIAALDGRLHPSAGDRSLAGLLRTAKG